MIRKFSAKIVAPVMRTSPVHGVPYLLIRSLRRSAVIRITGEGVVHLMAPKSFTLAYADEVIDLRHSWIEKRKASLSERIAIPSCEEKDKPILADYVRARATALISRYEGKKPKRIFIRFSKTSWGSCSTLGNISLSGYLYYLPDELLEYVLFHELSHLYCMNHSKEFWNHLNTVLPEPKLLRKKLSQYILPR